MTDAGLTAIGTLTDDLPALWSAQTMTTADHKKLVRTVVERVVVTDEKPAKSTRQHRLGRRPPEPR
ncbi:hypothetical protein [Nonomuraea jabiensis]|uniref:hypothetical protein n=1 Tax=Nonomuraea jabiensis TaxID=882448 RepID=UPI0036C7DD43